MAKANDAETEFNTMQIRSKAILQVSVGAMLTIHKMTLKRLLRDENLTPSLI